MASSKRFTQSDMNLVCERVKISFRENKSILKMQSKSELVPDEEIAQTVYKVIYKTWKRYLGKHHIKEDRIRYLTSDPSPEAEYARDLHHVLIKSVKQLHLTWNQILLYNRSWWKTPNNTINLFSPPHRQVDILRDNPYDKLYTKLNKHVITTNSQIHYFEPGHEPDEKSNVESDEPAFDPDDDECTYIQRPYITFLCTSQQADRIMAMNDCDLGVISISCNDFQFKINKVTESSVKRDEMLWVTYLLNRSKSLYDPNAYIFTLDALTDCNKMKSIVQRMIKFCRFVKDYKSICLTGVTVFYKRWHTDYHDNPTKYMLQTILETLTKTD